MRKIASLILAALLLAAMPARADEDQLPNLVPSKASNISVGRADSGDRAALRFDTTTANLGDHHFQLLGGRPTAGTTKSEALQCVRWEGRVCLDQRAVGTFDLHLSHGHWHLGGYALYELRRLDAQGLPDMTPAGLAVNGGKVSFCLLDVSPTSAAPRFPEDPFGLTGYYVGCLSVIQGISKGWADVYGSYLTGQQLLLDGVADGRYAIVITIDPDGVLLETSHADNMSWRGIALSNNATKVTLL